MYIADLLPVLLIGPVPAVFKPKKFTNRKKSAIKPEVTLLFMTDRLSRVFKSQVKIF